jgi:SsrA-binding protein
VEIALARGRRSFDKRQAIARRDADRQIARELSWLLLKNARERMDILAAYREGG